MFIDNRTPNQIVCKRMSTTTSEGEMAVAVLMEPAVYRRNMEGWHLDREHHLPSCLDRAVEAPAWDGTSFTASGVIQTPLRGSLVRHVALRAEGYQLQLVARGRRKWIRTGSQLVPGPIEPWEPLEMTWSDAYGGSFELPAGLDPVTGLPHPTVTSGHPTNQMGKGYFISADRAVGNEVPRIELLEDQLASFGQFAIPGCTAPCSGPAMGMTMPLPDKHPLQSHCHRSAFQMYHTAPAYLVLPPLAAGSRVSTKGFEGDLDFLVPTPRVKPRAKRGRAKARYGTRLRAVHLDTSRQCAIVIWQHVVVCSGSRIPDLEIREVSP